MSYSHRTAERHRIRGAQSARLDPETADRVMSREFRTATPRTEMPPPPPVGTAPAASGSAVSESPGALRVRLAWERITPDALAIPCPEHGAPVGVYCWPGVRAVCGSRVANRPEA